MSIVRLKALATMDWNDMWKELHSMSSAEVQKIFAEAVQESEARLKVLRCVVKVYVDYDELEDDEKESQTDRIVADLLNRYGAKGLTDESKA